MKKNIFKLTSLLILFFAFNLGINAQKVLKGTIYLDGKPAAGATVEVNRVSGSFFTSFDGKYEMTIHEKSKTITVTLNEEKKKAEITGDVVDIYFGQMPSTDSSEEAEGDGTGDCRTQNELKGEAEYQQLYVYNDFYKLKQYDKAYPKWSALMLKYPCSSRNVYAQGANILSYMITNEKDAAKKSKYIDTLMLMYDYRIKYFGKSKDYPKGYILGRKGKDLFEYRPEAAHEAHKMLTESVKLQGEKSEPASLLALFQTSRAANKDGKVTNEQVLDDYLNSSAMLEKLIKNAKTEDEKNAAQVAINGVEHLFSTSEVATCDDLVKIFKPKFEAAKDDVDLLKKITGILDKKDCTESDLFSEAAEHLYKKEPTSSSAYMLAVNFLKKKDLDNSAKYFLEAIKSEDNDSLKAKYYHKLGLVTLAQNKPQQAYNYAVQAKNSNPKWGAPYILMGLAYATGKDQCGASAFEQSAIFWFAVDKFITAKTVDPTSADEANRLIGQYSPHFPDKEEIFMQSLPNGIYSTLDKNCWIKEKTTARPANR